MTCVPFRMTTCTGSTPAAEIVGNNQRRTGSRSPPVSSAEKASVEKMLITAIQTMSGPQRQRRGPDGAARAHAGRPSRPPDVGHEIRRGDRC